MSSAIVRFFAYRHLPERLQEVSKPLDDLARMMDQSLNDSPEKAMGLRKLLEARECFLRAAL